MNRCVICDYTESEGSELLDKAPSHGNKVTYRPKQGDFLCDDCVQVVRANWRDLNNNEHR